MTSASVTLAIACAVVIVVCLLAWAYFTAHRLDRLHIRTGQAATKLEAALNRRAAVIAVVIPALAEAANKVEAIAVTTTTVAARRDVEAALEDATAQSCELMDLGEDYAALEDANARVDLAVRFYNQAVSDTVQLASHPLVRGLRLGGTAPIPQPYQLE